NKSGGGTKECGLAGAVGPEQGDDLAVTDAEVHVAQHDRVAIASGDGVQVEHGASLLRGDGLRASVVGYGAGGGGRFGEEVSEIRGADHRGGLHLFGRAFEDELPEVDHVDVV